MTPFMTRVADFLGQPGNDDLAGLAPRFTTMPETRISARVATSTGADKHVALRSLAEQYVCEANAVLGLGRDHLSLVDEAGTEELAFTVGYRDQGARCSTRFVDGRAFGQLVGTCLPFDEPQELEGPDALPDLLIRLMEAAAEAAPAQA